jgi:hypothetical protein
MVDQAGEYTPPKQASIEDVVLEARDFTSLEIPEKKSILSPWLNEQSIKALWPMEGGDLGTMLVPRW